GSFRKGDEVALLPSGQHSRIKSIEVYGREVEAAAAPQSVTLLLETDVDVSRGEMIVPSDSLPVVSQDIETFICWMDDRKELKPGNKFTLQRGPSRVRCSVKSIDYRVNINTYVEEDEVESLKL